MVLGCILVEKTYSGGAGVRGPMKNLFCERIMAIGG